MNDDEIATEFYEVTPLSHKRIALLICVTSRLILGDAMLGENRSSRRRYGITQSL